MIEIWKDIKGYEGLYQISNFGQVKSLKRVYYTGRNHTTIKICDEKILIPRKTKTGYCRVGFKTNGKLKDFYIHILVANAFLDNLSNHIEINHIDEDKSNNNVNNLEWCSRKYNCNYGTRNEKISIANKLYNINKGGALL